MIALNEFNHTGMAAEIKCNPRKISLKELQEIIYVLSPKIFGEYALSIQGLSIKNM